MSPKAIQAPQWRSLNHQILPLEIFDAGCSKIVSYCYFNYWPLQATHGNLGNRACLDLHLSRQPVPIHYLLQSSCGPRDWARLRLRKNPQNSSFTGFLSHHHCPTLPHLCSKNAGWLVATWLKESWQIGPLC